MESTARCKLLRAVFTQEKGCFGGPYSAEFQIDNPVALQIEVNQLGTRIINIISEVDVLVDDLYSVFTRIERLLMLFDGRFFPLTELVFSDSSITSQEQLSACSQHLLLQRLSYYRSSDFCICSVNKLLDFNATLTAELYRKWEAVLLDLDIVHQVFLYSLCDNKQPVDMKCSFMIELAEPLVEIVKAHRHIFEGLNPGRKGTSLKQCLEALVKQYGEQIFDKELSNDYDMDGFLQILVNSRVRIMHIKRRQQGQYLNGKESMLYIVKMYLLYRCILFDLLGISISEYRDCLLKCISYWNNLNDAMAIFLHKIPKKADAQYIRS